MGYVSRIGFSFLEVGGPTAGAEALTVETAKWGFRPFLSGCLGGLARDAWCVADITVIYGGALLFGKGMYSFPSFRSLCGFLTVSGNFPGPRRVSCLLFSTVSSFSGRSS